MIRRLAFPVLLGVLGVAILLALGTWQVQRLAWKSALIAEIEARIAADPVPVPAAPDPQRHRLLRVTATGRIGAQELHVLTSHRPLGAGYRVVSPMTLADGRSVLVDLGFVPQTMQDPSARPAPPRDPPDAERVTGLLLWPEEADGWTPEPDAGRNLWFARDVDAMAAALGTEPVLIVAQAHSLGDWPRPVPPGTDVPNRHLGYAVTWYGLALVWAVMTVLWIRAELRGRPVSLRRRR